MPEGQEPPSYVRVIADMPTGHVELRIYDTAPEGPTSLWIGMVDQAGIVRRTWISDAVELSSAELRRWLRPVVGFEAAGRLARMALDARARAVDGGGAQVVHLTGVPVTRAS